MDERKLRKGLLEQLISEMDKAELSSIPAHAEMEEQKAEEMAGKNAVDSGAKEIEVGVVDSPAEEIMEEPFEKEREKRLSRAASNLRSQMSFVK